MNMNKQTIWLVTMLSLMVVLSAYYIVSGPVEPAGQMAKKAEEILNKSEIAVDIKAANKPASATAKTDTKDAKQQKGSDYFVGHQLNREYLRQQLLEENYKMMMDPKATKNQLESASKKVEQLNKTEKQEGVLEDLICKELKFADAVVVTNEDHVDVIVKTAKLTPSQVVKVMDLVKQNSNVEGLQVTVSSHS
ncbi:SpoIIIAH-like family protein [Thermoactinomyces sp. DSM 45892]|uniref:SpoIIIAH-like family protein n=1 Tax=Thermoactinomyces sp. DSM 45892 TaxID=1882753 RepID=UPI00089A4DC4|nr:SpoIIIAH-like family protein [Thermoactinomyces sp. DSM 45892]SDX99583.1 stage III sporulation protein AH [Thermoactinomyces sp. DSM 45892]